MEINTYMWPSLTLALLLAACGNGGNENGKTSNVGGIDISDAIDAVEKRRKADPNASGGNTCLLAYQEKYDQLLTKELVLEATGFDSDKMEVKYSKIMKPEYHNVDYAFDNQRLRERHGYTLPFKDNVKLGRITAMSLAQFNDTHRAITDEEDETLDEVLEDMHAGRNTDRGAKDALKQLESQGVDKETTEKTTNVLRDAFKKISEGYRKVGGLGDAAVWNVQTMELVVLDNGVKFDLHVDVRDTVEENKEVAIALARKLLAVCD